VQPELKVVIFGKASISLPYKRGVKETNPEDLPEYIQPFTHLFNKKKFEKLPERHEWDHKINLMEEASKELNAKAYAMILKEEEALNQ